MRKEEILREYDQHAASLDQLGRELVAELGALLRARGHQVHTLDYRVKPRRSLAQKLARPDRTYECLWDITDVLGLRVITYFEDAVEAVAHLVEGGFQVDLSNSVDKRRRLGHDTFGYRSLHYVCVIAAERLAPGMPPRQARFELQLRTVLQHAWAEIEHDLGYKSQEVLPEALRRRFSRLAGLLELADEEFLAIRRALGDYEAQVRVARGAAELPLDQVSLGGLARDPVVVEIDEHIAARAGAPLSGELFFPAYLLKMLRLVGLEGTGAVRGALVQQRAEVLRIVPLYLDFARRAFGLQVEQVHCGYGLLFLVHALLLSTPELNLSKVERMTRFYQALDYPDDPRAAQRVASQLLLALAPAPPEPT